MIYTQGASAGRRVSRTYVTLATSAKSSDGAGHLRMVWYRFSENIGSGRSRKYFFSNTAAKWGSPIVSIDTTFPSNGYPNQNRCIWKIFAITSVIGFLDLPQQQWIGRASKKSILVQTYGIYQQPMDCAVALAHTRFPKVLYTILDYPRYTTFLAVVSHELFQRHAKYIGSRRNREADLSLVFGIFSEKSVSLRTVWSSWQQTGKLPRVYRSASRGLGGQAQIG